MLVLSFLQYLTLTAFGASFAYVLWHDRHNSFGIIVTEGQFILAKGRQGIVTTIGRSSNNDVSFNLPSVSRLQAAVSFDAKNSRFSLFEYGLHQGDRTDGYRIADRKVSFSLPVLSSSAFAYSFVPVLMCGLFVVIRAMRTYGEWHVFSAVLPHLLLLVFLLVSIFTRADRLPLTDCVFAIFLTYYIEAVMYPASLPNGDINKGIHDALLGVFLYVFCCTAFRLILCLNLDRHIGSKTLLQRLRPLCSIGIVVLIILNLALAKEKNGAYNWILLPGLNFQVQPSEFVKVLLILVMLVPIDNKSFYSLSNLIYMFIVPGSCFIYGYLIKDIGVILIFASCSLTAILLQARNITVSAMLILASLVGGKAILRFSKTAAGRLSGWLGGSNNLFQSLTGAGIFKAPSGYGYQSIHSLVGAVKNGGLFGNNSFDVLKNITAANSDLVMACLCQKNGAPLVFFILIFYCLLIVAVSANMLQQTKSQQTLSVISLVMLVFATFLNTCGSFSILPLTGVVNPAFSAGMSSAVYGCLFGCLGASAVSSKYLKALKQNENS